MGKSIGLENLGTFGRTGEIPWRSFEKVWLFTFHFLTSGSEFFIRKNSSLILLCKRKKNLIEFSRISNAKMCWNNDKLIVMRFSHHFHHKKENPFFMNIILLWVLFLFQCSSWIFQFSFNWLFNDLFVSLFLGWWWKVWMLESFLTCFSHRGKLKVFPIIESSL